MSLENPLISVVKWPPEMGRAEYPSTQNQQLTIN